MFDGIVAERAACDHCDRVRQVAHVPRAAGDAPYEVAYEDRSLRLCAGCIAKLQRLAWYLRLLEAKAPKKARKRATGQPRAIAGPSGPVEHEGEVLIGTRHG